MRTTTAPGAVRRDLNRRAVPERPITTHVTQARHARGRHPRRLAQQAPVKPLVARVVVGHPDALAACVPW